MGDYSPTEFVCDASWGAVIGPPDDADLDTGGGWGALAQHDSGLNDGGPHDREGSGWASVAGSSTDQSHQSPERPRQ